MISGLLRRFAILGGAVAKSFGMKIGGGLPAGAVPPPFEVETWFNTPEDEPVDLDGLRGHPVFVELWSIQCPPCVATVDKVRRIHAGYLPLGVRTVTVHVSLHDPPADAAAVETFLRERSIAYPVGFEASGTAWERFAFTRIPHGLLIGADGKVAWSGSLYTSDVETVLERFHGSPAPIDVLPTAAAELEPPAEEAPGCEGGVCRMPSPRPVE